MLLSDDSKCNNSECQSVQLDCLCYLDIQMLYRLLNEWITIARPHGSA